MTIANTIASKLTVALIAIAMIFAFSPSAFAAGETTEDLQKTINDLLAQVAALQADVDVSSGAGSTSSASFCPYTWTRDLKVGTSGADVMKLQQFLNSDPDTRVAATGVGSAGMETMTFGPLTAAAVSKFQVKYRAEILTVIGLVNPTGYFGSGSRLKANSLCVATGGGTGDDSDDDSDDSDDDSSDDSDDDSSGDLSGEASLDKFEIDDADDDTIEENQEDAEIGMFTVEFADGDAEISRLDISLRGDGETDTSDVAPWDAFDTISLWVDGDMIAEMDANDENEYLDEDDGSLRFSNLDLVAMEDEEVEITVGATMQNGLDTEELTTWNLRAEALRFFDADGVATTEDNIESIGDVNEHADFDVEMEGEGDDLSVRTATEDPDSTTLALEDDMKTDYVVFAFNLDAGDSDGDVEVNGFNLGVNASSSDGSTVVATTLLVDDIKVMVDGDEMSTDDVTVSDTNLTSHNGQIMVDFDNGDFMIDAEGEVLVEIEVSFKSLPSTREGSTIQLSLNGDDVDAEGADDILVDGAATGDVHTLRTEGLVLEMTDEAFTLKTNSDTTSADDVGEYTLKFEVTAFQEDFYFNKTAARGTTGTTEGAEFLIESNGSLVTTGTTTQSLTSTADTEGSRFVVHEGETETFTLKVNYDPATSGFYAVQLNNVNYFMASSGGTAASQLATPSEDFDTDESNI